MILSHAWQGLLHMLSVMQLKKHFLANVCILLLQTFANVTILIVGKELKLACVELLIDQKAIKTAQHTLIIIKS